MERFSDFRSLLVTLAYLLTFWDRSRFVSGSDEEGLLMHQLLGHAYNNLVRPRGEGVNGTLKVKIGMRLSQLLDIDEKNQIMKTSVWLHHEWSDKRLVWDPQDFGGIDMTQIPSSMLWKPDIVLYNNADGEFIVKHDIKAKVYSTGRIVWEPPAIYKSYCPIDVEFFPFDRQECFMKFGSWTYDMEQIDLRHICDEKAITYVVGDKEERVIDRGVDLKDVYFNVEWDILNVTATWRVKSFPCCDVSYPYIMFNITLRRRPLFYSLNLIMPCLSISGLTVLVFYLPSDSGEKITLSISILLALTVFFLLLSDISPPTSFVIPLISKYLLFTMIVVTLSIFLAVYTLGIHFRRPSTHKMSPWVKRVFTEILPKILLMKRPDLNWKSSDNKFRAVNGIEMQDVPDNHDMTTRVGWNASSTEGLRGRVPSRDSIEIKKYPREVIEAIERVKFVADHLRDADADNMEERDWKYVAMVMDRLFLYIFTTACVCGTLSIFLYAPSLYDPRGPLSLDDQLNCTY